MILIPEVKKYEKTNGTVDVSKINWDFSQCNESRVINEAHRIADNALDGTKVFVICGDENDESYEINIEKNSISIASKGASGAFYGLKTFSQMLQQESRLTCGKITDYPDMPYRGFYHDISRGKIPKLDTLKELADRLSCLKINSLQLYVEHTFEFPEYEFCRERLGCITEETLREFDAYCRERFIDLVPSLSCFGHLYHLLQDGPYGHLCELKDYEPYLHYFVERQQHHTINPLKDESFEIISGMIDTYASIFQSPYFNICCDETLDLGKGVNNDKSEEELYFGFVNKLINCVQKKGKQVMMWGDVLVNHPESVKKMPDDIIYLSWGYTENPPRERFSVLYELGKTQIVCPGTSSWASFTEDVVLEEKNIKLLSEYAHKYEAKGLLNTNWGDMGNLATISLSMYGMVCGAAVAWNSQTVFDRYFRKKVSAYFYGDETAVDVLAEFSQLKPLAKWYEILFILSAGRTSQTSIYYERSKRDLAVLMEKRKSTEEYEEMICKCAEIEKKITAMHYLEEGIKEDMLIAIRGNALLLKWNAALRGIYTECYVEYESWKRSFIAKWVLKNEPTELHEVIRIFDMAEKAYTSQDYCKA